MDIESIARIIVDSAIRVHRKLGPGLLESAYQQCLAYELRKRGLVVEREVPLPIVFGDQPHGPLGEYGAAGLLEGADPDVGTQDLHFPLLIAG